MPLSLHIDRLCCYIGVGNVHSFCYKGGFFGTITIYTEEAFYDQ